jgi:hypothetical protein
MIPNFLALCTLVADARRLLPPGSFLVRLPQIVSCRSACRDGTVATLIVLGTAGIAPALFDSASRSACRDRICLVAW